MAIIAPTPITAAPPVPDSGQPEPTFDAQYEDFNEWERNELVPGANALAQNVYANTLAAEEARQAAEEAAEAAALDSQATDADRQQTELNKSATNDDRQQTGLDKAATQADRLQTGQDLQQTGLDKAATAADRVQTGLDRAAAQVFATQQIKATSTTSVTPGAGNKTLTIESSRSFVAGMYLVATSAGVPGTRMSGYVVSYDMTTGQLVIAVDSYAGAAARADWQIGVAAPGGGSGAGLLTVQRITANTPGVANVHYVIGAAGIRLTIPSGMATDDRIAVSEDITPGLAYEIDFGTVPLRGFQNGLTQVISNRATIALRNVGGTTGLI